MNQINFKDMGAKLWYIEKKVGKKWLRVTWAASKSSAIDLLCQYAGCDPFTQYRFILK